MANHIVYIENPANLSLRYNQLFIEQEDGDTSIPLEDIDTIVLDNSRIRVSRNLLSDCSERNITIIICNDKHMPVSILLPLKGHVLHTRILRDQIDLEKEREALLWKQLIQGKISAQIQVLKKYNLEFLHLIGLNNNLDMSNTSDKEAQAARIYWKRLFGIDFRRKNNSKTNSLLNYGYSLIRSSIAKSIVASGLHPALGVHHKNQYNSFCLVDDLIEPLRPIVDSKVYEMREKIQEEDSLNREDKIELLTILNQKIYVNNTLMSLQPAIRQYTTSFKQALTDNSKLEIPIL